MAVVTWTQNSLGKWEANGSADLSWEQIYHSPHMRALLVASGQLHSAYLNQKSPAEEKYELTGWTGQPRDPNNSPVVIIPRSAVTDDVDFRAQEGGLLDGQIFGISKKLLLAGAVAWFVLTKK